MKTIATAIAIVLLSASLSAQNQPAKKDKTLTQPPEKARGKNYPAKVDTTKPWDSLSVYPRHTRVPQSRPKQGKASPKTNKVQTPRRELPQKSTRNNTYKVKADSIHVPWDSLDVYPNKKDEKLRQKQKNSGTVNPANAPKNAPNDGLNPR